jgi:hypothetical protein
MYYSLSFSSSCDFLMNLSLDFSSCSWSESRSFLRDLAEDERKITKSETAFILGFKGGSFFLEFSEHFVVELFG